MPQAPQPPAFPSGSPAVKAGLFPLRRDRFGSLVRNRARRQDRRRRSERFGFVANPLVLRPDDLLAVGPLQSTNREMSTRDILKMIDEGIVHGRPAERADDRERLRREL